MADPNAAPLLSGAPYMQGIDALLIADAASADVVDALSTAGIRLRSRAGLALAQALLEETGAKLVLLDARGAGEDALAPAFAAIAARDAEAMPALIVLLAAAQLDLAAPLLGTRGVQLLCDPGAAALLAALVLAHTGLQDAALFSVNDITRDSESARLRRLSEEVARIADALTRLTRGELAEEEEIERRGGIREPEMGYRGPEGPVPEIDPSEIRAVIRARRLRNQFFSAELFADPAWDMLLDLFAASLEKRRVSVSSLCIAAAVPPTTALRWIGTMHDAGLFGREADPGDRRRAYIVLSEKAMKGMHAYIGALRRTGLGLV
ncbi:hypothetical protein P6144_12420 [Sphingomonas sp. HITSZ_GF]|uniref:hypothetical protein n=1 Tax=Sphingomonas sp. HITSZ_GF TaxID=3037247 RepID=UPI00240E3464|nr:hypothetical protein [Sphingomonas sp. HITSZ_GF]MDG2534459.1 hypothetical protein [Sphingomonas sp. HITSZ_GF]